MLINQGASLKDLAVTVIVAFLLLTALDFAGAGHHSPAPSTGAVSAPKTSLDHSRQWSGQDEASRSSRPLVCRNCGIVR